MIRRTSSRCVDYDIYFLIDLPDRDGAGLAVVATSIFPFQHIALEDSGRVRGVESALYKVPLTLGLVPFEDETLLRRHDALSVLRD